jgi:hypothetical protein
VALAAKLLIAMGMLKHILFMPDPLTLCTWPPVRAYRIAWLACAAAVALLTVAAVVVGAIAFEQILAARAWCAACATRACLD